MRHSDCTPHSRRAKKIAKQTAERCRRREMTPDDCHFFDDIPPGCPHLAFGLHCSEVQEGHWTRLLMNWWCRHMGKRRFE